MGSQVKVLANRLVSNSESGRDDYKVDQSARSPYHFASGFDSKAI